MKNPIRFWTSSGPRLILVFSIIAGSMASAGCSDPSKTVTQDPSKTKNKRTARIERLRKGGNPNLDAKKAGP